MDIQVTITAPTPAGVLAKLQTAVLAWGGSPQVASPAPKAAAAKKAKPAATEVVAESLADEPSSFGEETFEDAGETFGDEPEVVETKDAKAPKVDVAAVHAACLAHAKKHSRPETMKVLAKYKVKSVSELKPETYAAVVKALKV